MSNNVTGILLCVPAVIILVAGISRYVDFEQQIRGHLKRAADASNPEMAIKELDYVIQLLEERRWTTGSSYLVYETPEADVGFWYRNIAGARDSLADLADQTSELEKSNTLMRVRETLMDERFVTHPPGMSLYPHYRTYVVFGVLAFGLAVLGVSIACGERPRYGYRRKY